MKKHLKWLRERWAATSVAKKCVAAAGSAILAMGILGAFALLGTPLTRREIGFTCLAAVVVSVTMMVVVLIDQIRRYPQRSEPFPRHSAGDSGMSTAEWNRRRDAELLSQPMNPS